jgi:diaminopropionate ammonia-lyase
MQDMGTGLRCLVNPAMAAGQVAPPAGDAVTAFHRNLPGYAPTPLRRIGSPAPELGAGQVWLKDESDRFGLPAFKMLGASWAVAQALRRRRDASALVAASAGNHGRAVARCAARSGLACRVHLPVGTPRAAAAAIGDEGAQVVYANGTYDDAVAAAEGDAGRTGAVLIADVARRADEPSAGWVIDGYATLFREIDDQLPAGVDVILVPTGVGALAAAAARWAAHNGGRCRVIAVEPVNAAGVLASLRAGRPVHVPTAGTDMAGLNCPAPSVVAWPSLRDGLLGAVAVTDYEVHEAMRELARHAMTIGACGAAPLAALRVLATGSPECNDLLRAARLPGATVVCLGTEGITDPDGYRSVLATTA